MRGIVALLMLVFACVHPSHAATKFSAPGDLEANSGKGFTDGAIFLPDIRFPIEKAPAFLNSQVYRPGGSAKGGDQCNSVNYSYPWRDNFCESRQWAMPLCPAGKGHQGQDIRPSTCVKNLHWAVAVEDGIISNIGKYSVTLQGKSGTIYRYLHLQMDDLAVYNLKKVFARDRIGKVSNNFGDTATTIHLHFDAKRAILVKGRLQNVFVPPYSSLVASYKRLIGE